MNERWLKDRVDARLKALKSAGAPIWWLKIHGGPMQRAGVPDYLLCVAGRFGAMELKSPEETPQFSLNQKREAEWITSAGGVVLLSNKLTDIDGYLNSGLK